MHLFIVSEETFPVHLAYGFAGVSKPTSCSWANVNINPQAERAQAAQYADVCRVHAGDEMLFYLERPGHDVTREGGRFYGVFEVVSEFPFYEPSGTYLKRELDKPLIYRFLIQPKQVYSRGLTEWQAMDEMTDFRRVSDIPWTLIYRKMTAGRGCTPLLPHEAASIRQMLDLRNSGRQISSHHVAFRPETLSLESTDHHQQYAGNTARFDRIDDWLLHLMNNTNRQWELQLQAYLMQEIGRNDDLTRLLFPGVDITWIGNEVYAGAGMQSIDILVFSRNALNGFVHLIELKSTIADEEAADQLNRYVKWLRAHIPDISVHQIIPTLIAPDASDGFHERLRTYLVGHGIVEYRLVTIDNTLNLSQTFYTDF